MAHRYPFLGILDLVAVPTLPVLTEKECCLITIALEHLALYRDWPITTAELLRLADDLDEKEQRVCMCTVHTSESHIDPHLLTLLQNIMTCTSELKGRLLSGNLTNIAIYLLTYVLHFKAGLTDLQIQAEVKSESSIEHVGSKVVFNLGCGDHHLTVESTPDFYIRRKTPIVYLVLGEVHSIGSKDPEIQLAIGCLGMLSKRRTTKIGAMFVKKDLTCCVYLGTCTWDDSKYGRVSFKRVNRADGYQLEDPKELGLFCRTLIAVARQIMESRPLSPPTLPPPTQ